jgi:hypothetical protein
MRGDVQAGNRHDSQWGTVPRRRLPGRRPRSKGCKDAEPHGCPFKASARCQNSKSGYPIGFGECPVTRGDRQDTHWTPESPNQPVYRSEGTKSKLMTQKATDATECLCSGYYRWTNDRPSRVSDGLVVAVARSECCLLLRQHLTQSESAG